MRHLPLILLLISNLATARVLSTSTLEWIYSDPSIDEIEKRVSSDPLEPLFILKGFLGKKIKTGEWIPKDERYLRNYASAEEKAQRAFYWLDERKLLENLRTHTKDALPSDQIEEIIVGQVEVLVAILKTQLSKGALIESRDLVLGYGNSRIDRVLTKYTDEIAKTVELVRASPIDKIRIKIVPRRNPKKSLVSKIGSALYKVSTDWIRALDPDEVERQKEFDLLKTDFRTKKTFAEEFEQRQFSSSDAFIAYFDPQKIAGFNPKDLHRIEYVALYEALLENLKEALSNFKDLNPTTKQCLELIFHIKKFKSVDVFFDIPSVQAVEVALQIYNIGFSVAQNFEDAEVLFQVTDSLAATTTWSDLIRNSVDENIVKLAALGDPNLHWIDRLNLDPYHPLQFIRTDLLNDKRTEEQNLVWLVKAIIGQDLRRKIPEKEKKNPELAEQMADYNELVAFQFLEARQNAGAVLYVTDEQFNHLKKIGLYHGVAVTKSGNSGMRLRIHIESGKKPKPKPIFNRIKAKCRSLLMLISSDDEN
ncbi:MAG: hypothetical protein AB7F43_12160 [Bacteriovoracia bacterium]